MTTGNRQTARSQAARDNIVQAALTVFALKGYAATSMDDVCLAAGCSKGGLYHHFRTKSAVLRGVVGRLAQSRALLPQPGSGEGAAPAPEPSIGRVLLDVWAEAARDDDLRTQLRASYESSTGETQAVSGRPGLAEILQLGALVQLLTRFDEANPKEAARRLGIERAA
jgi:AcrR family transcriptional regulator